MGILATRLPFHIRRGGFIDEVGGCLLPKKDFTPGSFVLSNHFRDFHSKRISVSNRNVVAPALNRQPLTDKAYIDTRPLRVGFVVQKVTLGQVFLLVL
jgi:hypothetical protein